MMKMDDEGVRAWDARLDEVIVSFPVSEERAAEISELYPPMSDEDIEKILYDYKH